MLVFLADGLGWALDELKESVAPMLATKILRPSSSLCRKAPSQACGNSRAGVRDGKEVLTLELQMYVGAPNPRDTIEIVGENRRCRPRH